MTDREREVLEACRLICDVLAHEALDRIEVSLAEETGKARLGWLRAVHDDLHDLLAKITEPM
jgi:hypothetical protein